MNRGGLILIPVLVVIIVSTLFISQTSAQQNSDNLSVLVLLKNPQGFLVVDLSKQEHRGLDVSELYDIQITTETSSFRYIGALVFPLNAELPVEEVKTITLFYKNNNSIIQHAENPDYKIKTSGLNNNQQINQGSKKCEGAEVFVEKNNIFLGESNKIFMLNQPDINTYTEIQIINENKIYKLFDARDEAVFFPPNYGRFEVFYLCNGEIISSKEFFVRERSIFDVPFGKKPFILRDSKNNDVETLIEMSLSMDGKVTADLFNPVNNVNWIRFKDLNVQNVNTLKIEEVKNALVNGEIAVNSYAIDPTLLDFEEATISAVAKGTQLFKCKDYDFDNQVCFGTWEKLRDITPGEEYRITLTPEDPLFSELNSSISCSCQHSASSDDGTRQCNVYCPFTINIPGNSTSFYMSSIIYNVTITVTSTGTITGGLHYGFWDHDQTHTNSDDVRVGSSTTTSTTTLIWTNSTIPNTGSRSFTHDDCNNWPNYCNYYVYLNASMSFTTPGGSSRAALVNISLNSVNYTINYTAPGPFSVVLNNPVNEESFSYKFVMFNYTPTASNPLANCSLYTNESGWNIRNTSFSITNGSINTIGGSFSQDGTFLWNIVCYDNVTNLSTTGVLNRTLYIDSTPPVISLVYPGNGGIVSNSNVIAFYFNVTDLIDIQNCSLYIDGTSVQTSSNILKNQNQSIQYLLQNGVYDWSVGCYDLLGNNNISNNFTVNVSVPQTILRGNWYETFTSNCGSIPCSINAAQQTDGTNNYITGTIPSDGTQTIVQATSSYLNGDGGVINSGSTVSFSTYFQSRSANGLTTRWYLYVRNSSNQDTLICSNTGGVTITSGAASTGTCSALSTFRFLATDRFFYEIEIANTNPPGAKTFNHTIDHPSSFFNLTNYTQLGFFSTELLSPLTNQTLLQGESFNLTCGISCSAGTCFNTNVYAQINSSGSWTNIGSSGILTLNGSQTNPNSLGNLYNTTLNSSFAINASSSGTTYVRCFANTTYSNSTGSQLIRVVVGAYQAPIINLVYPGNNSWINFTNITFRYTPTSGSSLLNCSLYLNGNFNQSNLSPVPNVQNNFTINNLPEGNYNWSVSCTDINILTGFSNVYYFRTDTHRPYAIDLNAPDDLYFTSNPTILFNWTAYDNIADNLTCRLIINGTTNQTVTSYNATPTEISVGIFPIGTYYWNVSCMDYANNTNISETRNFTVSDESPEVNLYYPLNNTGVNTLTPTLIYNASDNYELTECRLYINGEYNQSNQSSLINGFNNFTLTLQEQRYNWSVTCFDDGGNDASTQNFTFRVDTSFPTIELFAPTPAQYLTNSSTRFNFTATDYPGSTLQCVVNVDDVQSIFVNATSGSLQSILGYGYADGIRFWNVSCSDLANNTNFSETRNFTINETPRININSPLNNSHILGNVTIIYTAVDNDGFDYCELYVNGGLNQTNSSPVLNGTQNNFSLINPSEGYYNWYLRCVDAGIYSNEFVTATRTFVVDNNAPIVNLSAPENNFTIEEEFYSFNWTVTDNYAGIMLCNVYINNTLNVSNVLSQNSTLTNYTISGLRTGSYNWSVSCIDNALITGYSQTWNYTVILPPRVNLTSPANYTGTSSNPVTFYYIPSLGSGAFPNCTLILNGQSNLTNYSIVPDVENNFTLTLPEGIYDWNVQCYDTNNLVGMNEFNWTYFVDTTDPYRIDLITPEEFSTVTKNNVTFTFSVFDSISETLYCDIYLNDTGIVYPILSNQTVQNDTNYAHYELLPDGNYSWFVFCMDMGGNFNETNQSDFYVVAPPNVTLMWPNNFYWNNTGIFNLVYLPEDDYLIKNCSLFLNGEFNQSNSIIFANQNNTFPLSNILSGEYNWTVGCYDSDDNFFWPENRTFYIDYNEPQIVLNAPSPGDTLSLSSVLFNWTANDDMAFNLTCELNINGTINQSNITVQNGVPYNLTVPGLTDGLFFWNISCIDQATNYNYSETRNFTVQESPRVSLGNPINTTRTNITTQIFFFTPSDNSGQIQSCTIILNGVANETLNTVLNNQENNITVSGLVNGAYNWDVNCTDYSGNTGNNITGKTIYIDLQGPYIELSSPLQGETFNQNDIFFNWTTYDFNSSVLLTCSLLVTDPLGDRLIENLTSFSGETQNYTVLNLSDGYHEWNVTCYDDLGNYNYSETRTFNINQPDLYVDWSRISFSDLNPDLYETFNITANVSNLGGLTANNVLVEFWNGDPGFGGVFIGNDTGTVLFNSSTMFRAEWSIPPGYHEIFVLVDPFNLIGELNETNNNASTNISAFYVNITHPENNTQTIDTTPRIDFNITDFVGGLVNYTIYVDNLLNGQSGQINDGENTTINLNALSDGVHTVIVQGRDSINRIKNSSTITIIVDTTFPYTYFITNNATWNRINNVSVLFNISDNFSTNIDYKVFLNNVLDETNTTTSGAIINKTFSELLEGRYIVIIEATDQLGNTGNSTLFYFYVDTTPPNSTIVTQNGTWYNTGNPQIQFNLTDNMDLILNYTVFVNQTANVSGTSNNASISPATLIGLTNGSYSIIVQALDEALNIYNSSPIIIYVDTVNPLVFLEQPGNNTNHTTSVLEFNFTTTDNMADYLFCNITIDNVVVGQNIQAFNGVTQNYTVSNLVGGYHYWNVSCIDRATNRGISDTWRFYILQPDIYVNSSEIYFSNIEPRENETVEITATIRNIGNTNAGNFMVQFWRGNPSFSGVQINGNFTINLTSGESKNLSVNFTIPIGVQEIFVLADTPISANGSVSEENEFNNVGSRNITVGLWHYAFGNTYDRLVMNDGILNLLFDWGLENSTGSNIFVTDFDSDITWTELQSIGRDSSNASSMSDFEILDEKLNSTYLPDSVNRTFTLSGVPIETIDFEIYRRTIQNVPVTNSTNNTNFKTGILWDVSDGGIQYNGSQDIIFISNIGKNLQGYNNTVDFEIRIPATLRSYSGPDFYSVKFYVELR